MVIAYICDFFHPYAGYHPNLLSKYWARFGHKVYMLTSEMDKIPRDLTEFFGAEDIEEKDRWFEKEFNVDIVRLPLIAYKSGRSIYKRKIFSYLKQIDPDVVFVNGNDTLIGIELTLRYKKNSWGLVMDSHMLEMASNNRFRKAFRTFYRKCVTPVIIKNAIPVIRTQDDLYVEKCLGIPVTDSPWISFGTDMTLFRPDSEQRRKFREDNKIDENAFVVLYAGKLTESKGASILADAVHRKLNSNREIVFLFIGNTEGEYGDSIEREFSSSNYRVIRYPTQKYFDLPKFYQAADVAVFPKQCSLSFFDVQACGLPVIFEDNEINIERCTCHNAMTYKTNCIEDFCDKLFYFSNLSYEEYNEYSRNAYSFVLETYNYETKALEYIPYLERQMNAKKIL